MMNKGIFKEFFINPANDINKSTSITVSIISDKIRQIKSKNKSVHKRVKEIELEKLFKSKSNPATSSLLEKLVEQLVVDPKLSSIRSKTDKDITSRAKSILSTFEEADNNRITDKILSKNKQQIIKQLLKIDDYVSRFNSQTTKATIIANNNKSFELSIDNFNKNDFDIAIQDNFVVVSMSPIIYTRKIEEFVQRKILFNLENNIPDTLNKKLTDIQFIRFLLSEKLTTLDIIIDSVQTKQLNIIEKYKLI